MAFLPDDPDERLFGRDIAFPFALTATGDLATVVGEDNVMQALPTRAMTVLGEIPVFPDDGLDLDELEGTPSVEVMRALIRARVQTQFQRDDRLESLVVTTEDGPAGAVDTLVRAQAQLLNGRTIVPTITFGGT